jgi:hypothetical protein
MKISLCPKLGFIHVKGGRFLRVTTAHRVLVGTLNEYEINQRAAPDLLANGEPRPPRFPRGTSHVFTNEGDLALEIVNVKTGKPLGHTYLSGPALLLNSYDAHPEWFRQATGVRVEIPGPASAEDTMESVIQRMADDLVPFKHSESIDAAVFQVVLPPTVSDEVPSAVCHCIIKAWMTSEAAPTDICHLIGVSERDKERRTFAKKPKPICIGLHFQPPRDACDFQVGIFQTGLALTAVGIEAS